jgi:hypothetical protein
MSRRVMAGGRRARAAGQQRRGQQRRGQHEPPARNGQVPTANGSIAGAKGQGTRAAALAAASGAHRNRRRPGEPAMGIQRRPLRTMLAGWWVRAEASPRAARNTLLVAWGATRLLLVAGMLLGSPIAAGQWPYRDFAVEYPPLAVLMIVLPALPLLPFATLAPRPDPAFVEPLRSLPHPDPVRYGAYGISFAVEMLLLDLLALWLVRRAGQRLAPGDRYGLRSGLLYVGLIFLSGALLQKFDLVAGVLCLAAVVALVERRDALGWGALAAAALVKGFPILALPVLVAYVVALAAWGKRAFDSGGASAGRPYRRETWRRLRVGAAGFVVVTLVGVLPVLLAAGIGPLARAVLYHADRATEIESLYGTLQLALGWLPGMATRTRFNYADLSRVVRSPLDAATPALAVAALGLFLLLAYAGVWRALIAGAFSRRGVWRTPVSNGPPAAARREGARVPISVSRKDERAQTLNSEDIVQSQAQAQALAVGVAAVLLAFTLAFRALPAHYLLVVLPLAAVIRLPRAPGRGQRIWLGALVGTAVVGQLLTAAWQALVALRPWAVALLSIRNIAWVIAFGCLVVALWHWPRSPAGGRRRG